MKHLIIIVIAGWSIGQVWSQTSSSDPIELSYSEFLYTVKQYHPIAEQGNLLLASGENELLFANGNFDPNLSAGLQQKKFKDDPYYSLFNTELTIPTKIGLDIAAGYDRTSGINLNPQNLDPSGGLIYAGFNLPIGQGLLYDKRRAQIDKAELMVDMSDLQRSIVINELLRDAGTAYWEWWEAYMLNQLLKETVIVANQRLTGVIQSVAAGDKPGIDSVEAKILVQTLSLEQKQAFINYLSSSLTLSTFLWDSNGSPVLIEENISPQIDISPITQNPNLRVFQELSEALVTNPLITQYDNKIEQLLVQKRLAKEGKKPKVNLKYNFLLDGSPGASISANNYTWAIDLSVPLLFRQAKANIQRADIDLQTTELQQIGKVRELENKLSASLAKWQNYIEQYQQANSMVDNYRTMVTAEQILLDNGESSLFLINSRQNKLLVAEQKKIHLLRKIRESILQAYFYAGIQIEN